MIPNMYKIAGELTPAVIHVASRAVATHALSIFGDHSDVMAARPTGWAMLCSGSVQEAQDLALVAHGASLRSRVPFLHFFDGFRTSHEVNTIEALAEDDLRAIVDDELVDAHRGRALDPERPVLRGSAQNPDVYFQAREAVNPYYDAAPGIVQQEMDRVAARTGRAYRLVEYSGHPEAQRVLVLMGSAAGAAAEAIEALLRRGERVGLAVVRLYRPFPAEALVEALPPGVRRIAVLDRTKEPGAPGEPLFLDVVAALAGRWAARHAVAPVPQVIGGRYGLASKEFTPAMAAAVLGELGGEAPRRTFTVGITDDLTRLSLTWERGFPSLLPAARRASGEEGHGGPRGPSGPGADVRRAIFYGLGSDGSVGAARATARIIAEAAGLHVQAYFVYDSRKAGAVTVSHLRFGPGPIRSSYLIDEADFVGCHQFPFLFRMDVLEAAARGATFLLDSPFGPEEVWDRIPVEVQRQILEKSLRVFVVDARRIARECGLDGRITTVMQPCFFALCGVLPLENALRRIRESIRAAWGKRGEAAVRRNEDAADRAIGALHEARLGAAANSTLHREPPVVAGAPDFVKRVTSLMIAGRGDLLPVSALPPDGTFPVGTARYEKRSIATEIPVWEQELCVDCGLCALVCPHATIRAKVYDADALRGAPEGFRSKSWGGKEFAGRLLTIQVAPDDCTGCGMCVEVCPAHDKEAVRRKAMNMEPKAAHLDRERRCWAFFEGISPVDRRTVPLDTVRGVQVLDPLFEFSSACAGCGETPYLRLLTQLFGDRILIANATGCSSIYGGNLPTTPWSCDREGRGPAWSNSLFEDNAEFGLGMRLALDTKEALARGLLERLAGDVGPDLAREILESGRGGGEEEVAAQRARVRTLKERLRALGRPEARRLLAVADVFVPRSVWIVGGDGWAYDIGFGGLDHVLAGGRDINVLVLDTEVYSNTGGQASKATPRAAIAKFASGGKTGGKKDLGLLAMAYGNVYVARVAMGANPQQTVRSFVEAEAYRGPSLIIAYSHCIAHGFDMRVGMNHQRDAVATGYWPLYRYDPRRAHAGEHPLHLDSRRPARPFRDFALSEARFAMLARANPRHAARLMDLAQKDIDERWHLYVQMIGLERTVPDLQEPSP
jgi:pyruvate-ferredoxin/flavodoxin oxidoreductase